MTYKEFDQQWKAIHTQPFAGHDLNPIQFGIQRSAFEEKKLILMIALASKVALPTAERKKEVWTKRLKKIRLTRERFEKLHAEMNPPAAIVQKKRSTPPVSLPSKRVSSISQRA